MSSHEKLIEKNVLGVFICIILILLINIKKKPCGHLNKENNNTVKIYEIEYKRSVK